MTAPTKEQQKIFAGFKKLREEQQLMVADYTRFAGELRETKGVLKSLDKWDNTNRKFYHRVVDALLEFNGPEMVERLSSRINELEEKMKQLDEALKTKGTELQEYTEKHKVRIVAQ